MQAEKYVRYAGNGDIYIIPAGKNAGSFLTGKPYIKYLRKASEPRMRLLLYLAERGGACLSLREAAEELYGGNIRGTAEIGDALEFWRECGVVEYRVNPVRSHPAEPEEKPVQPAANGGKYSIDDICDAFENKKGFRELVDELQNIIGDILNPHEIGIVYNLYVLCGTEYALICAVARTCAESNKTSLAYIERTVIGLCSDGVNTAEIYNRRMEAKRLQAETEEYLAGLLGKSTFTSKERGMVGTWVNEFAYGRDIIAEAHAVSVRKIEKPTMPYMNAVIQSWHEKGFKSLDEIRSEFNLSDREIKQKSSSFNIEAFFEKAVQASKNKRNTRQQ